MIGILLALLGALLLVLADSGKKRIVDEHSLYPIVWNTLVLGIISNCIYIAAVGMPELDWANLDWNRMLRYLPISILFYTLGEIAFMNALRSADFSLSQPFKAFVPVMGIPVSYYLLGEIPGKYSLIGALLAFLGAYLMFAPQISLGGFFEPIRALAGHKAPRLMFFCAFIAASSAALQKLASEPTAVVFYMTLVFIGELVVFSALLIVRKESPLIPYRGGHGVLTVLVGILWGAGMTVFYTAATLTYIVNILVIGQLQPLLSIPIGHYLFREPASRARMLPCAAMVAGVLIVVLFGAR